MRARMPWRALALLALGATPALAAEAGAASGGDPMTILMLYLGGLAFLLFEFFLVPGFGLPGLIGCGLILSNAYLVFHHYGSGLAWTVLAVQVLAGAGLTYLAMKVLPHTAVGQAMTHATSLETPAAPPTLDPDLWVGRTGEAAGALSPRGSVRIDGEELEARAKSGLIKEGSAVEVVAVEGRTLVVTRAG